MVNPVSLLNLVHQETKYTPALGKAAASKLEAGQTLTSVASELRVSRASLRNWRDRDPKLNEAFGTFEANKVKAEAKRQRIKHYKQMADGIVDAARQDAEDPVKAAQEAQQQAKAKEVESKPISPKEARERRLQVWYDSNWDELVAQQQEQIEAEKMQQVMALRAGFWCG